MSVRQDQGNGDVGDAPEVVVAIENQVGRLRVNRPKALNALTLGMCETMLATLASWRDDPAVRLVLLDHVQGRGFCAGGDVRLLWDSGHGDGSRARLFFFEEYRLNHLLFTYPKPVVAIVDGIVMGGGVGISQPARYRLATERTAFAMPESTIGMFTDVGGGWYLSRLPGRIGEYLGLTGARIDGAECMALGLATHYVASDRIDALKAALLERPDQAERLLDEATETPPPAAILDHRERIDRLFAADTYEEILAALDADGSEWAAKQRALLGGKSPQACKVTLRLIREARGLTDFADEMRVEYRLAGRVIQRNDFLEGVRALLIDKDNQPKWDPATPEGVSAALVDGLFAPLDEEWTPLPL